MRYPRHARHRCPQFVLGHRDRPEHGPSPQLSFPFSNPPTANELPILHVAGLKLFCLCWIFKCDQTQIIR
ncbi:hypothetical protein BsWGS_16981 [Bradybaena similaris]